VTPQYDTSKPLPRAQLGNQHTKTTYDPGQHTTPVASTSPAAPAPGIKAVEPITWIIDALGNRVELTPPTPPPDPEGDQPIVVIKPS
jgi:hypothetical protein